VSGVASDASPLIALHQIGQLGLLGTIFGSVLIPPAVAREVASVERPAWIQVRALEAPLASAVVSARLGPGEEDLRKVLARCHPRERTPIGTRRR
jgi:predicted nucleic acid-binding protein